MKIRILAADDSSVMRIALKTALRTVPEIEIETVSNGDQAIEALKFKTFDWLILDMEMPVCDGLQTLRRMKELKIELKTIIFAAHTAESYPRILEALKLGAIEFVSKPSEKDNEGVSHAISNIRDAITPLIWPQFSDIHIHHAEDMYACRKVSELSAKIGSRHFEAIVVASSTGGPLALEILFSLIGNKINVPIFLVQHMPADFTAELASRIQALTGAICIEGKDGEAVDPGRIYVAPGDHHMEIVRNHKKVSIKLDQGPKIQYVRPAADVLFTTAAEAYGKNLLAFVLTGMGCDGAYGSSVIKSKAGTVVIQDKDSSVVWGMPGSVHAQGSYDLIANIRECASVLRYYSCKG